MGFAAVICSCFRVHKRPSYEMHIIHYIIISPLQGPSCGLAFIGPKKSDAWLAATINSRIL